MLDFGVQGGVPSSILDEFMEQQENIRFFDDFSSKNSSENRSKLTPVSGEKFVPKTSDSKVRMCRKHCKIQVGKPIFQKS